MPDGDVRLAARSGSVVSRSNRKALIRFGLLRSDPRMRMGMGMVSRHVEIDGGMEGLTAISRHREDGDTAGGTGRELQAG
ncbi:hypothetical protein RchiOBHm_Chr5g0023321 [Rosa chinensis]|uniref:Uncharacterized protein n=1 Tax=Rosa chinensis TaxID=74649 RepID=A0A2P6Q815_ROSCH|nr:hypothetical protein RchiOBHm_Chr5g0023321 [Rosa chinensis]